MILKNSLYALYFSNLPEAPIPISLVTLLLGGCKISSGLYKDKIILKWPLPKSMPIFTW